MFFNFMFQKQKVKRESQIVKWSKKGLGKEPKKEWIVQRHKHVYNKFIFSSLSFLLYVFQFQIPYITGSEFLALG